MRTWLVILSLVCGAVISNAQTKVQFINCIADPAYPVLDVWVIQNSTATKVADDLGFTKCTPYIDIPAGINTRVCAAPPNSNSIADTITSFLVDWQLLRGGELLFLPLTGVLDKGFVNNPDGKNTGFGAVILQVPKKYSSSSTELEFYGINAVTDSRSINPILPSGKSFVGSVPFLGYSGRTNTSSKNNSTIVLLHDTLCEAVGKFNYDLNEFGGKLGILCIAGFVDPANNKNGHDVTMFFAWADGTTSKLQSQSKNELRIPFVFMNSIADPEVTAVDVYFNKVKVADNLEFRTSTQSDTLLITNGKGELVVTEMNSSGIDDKVLFTESLNVPICKAPVVVLHGVITTGFKVINNRNIHSTATLLPAVVSTILVSSTTTYCMQLATDAPTCTIRMNDQQKKYVFNNVDYSSVFIPDRALFPNNTTISVRIDGEQDSLVYNFNSKAHAGQRGIFILSGFKSVGENKNGKPLELMYAPIGTKGAWESLNGTSAVYEDKVSNTKMLLYPNPSDYNVQVHFRTESTNAVTIEVNDMVGNVVGTTNIGVIDPGEHVYTISTSTLPTGVYTCVVKKDNQLITSRFMVVR